MLKIHEVTSATDAKKYYAVADYYSQGQETVGEWGGKLADQLGLSGKVTKEAFDRMVDNQHPATGKALTPRNKDNRRVGYDFTVSVPKSASILRAFASEGLARELDAVRDRAISGMMAEVEPDMQTRVRKDDAAFDRTTGNMAWAAFHHTTSRPVKGKAPDMHEHTHLLVFNATMDSEENRIKAGQFGNLKRDGEYYAAVFDSLYARELETLGFVIDRQGGKKWEIAGIPASMVDKFKKRTDEVEDEAARRGIIDAVRKAELGAKTRSKKQKELTPADLRIAWDAQLTDAERGALAAVYRREAEGGPAVTPAEAAAYAIAHVSEKLSVFPKRELKRVALFYGLGSVTPEQIAAELPRHGVITSEIDGRLMATTEKLQREEDYIVGQAAGGRGSVAPVGVADGLTRTMANGKPLNDGQWDATCGLLNSENRVDLVEGPAGAGKSSLLGKFDEGMKLAGEHVSYFATTAAAVKVLQDDGFNDAKTVAHLLVNEKLQAAIRGSRVVVDETSMLGHKDAVRLFKLAEQLDLRITFVGDPMQHGAVARGALMHVLKAYGGIKPFKLTEILRQENPQYRAAAKLLSEGKTVEGFDAIDAMGRIEEVADSEDRYRRMAVDYRQALDELKNVPENNRVLVVSPTHAEAKNITAAIRSELRDAGKLGTKDREFTRLVQIDASEAERTQASTYQEGDVIQFHQNAKGFTKGERLTVTDPAAVPLEHAARFSLYRPEAIALTERDRIRFTGNVPTIDGEHTLKNGMVRTIAGFTAKGIKLDNGWVIPNDAGHFRHGFVETSFGAQGRTVHRVILGMPVAAMGAMNMQQLYVSASRAKESIRLYTDDKAEIREAVKRSSLKLAALDLPRRQQPLFKPSDGIEQHMERRRRMSVVNWMRSAWERDSGHRDKPKVKQKESEADYGYGQ
jgi:conjugative relaxase-like TrwC/TraI family protein